MLPFLRTSPATTTTAVRCTFATALWRPTVTATAAASSRFGLSARCFSTHAHAAKPRVLVVGGSGALGSAMIDTFKNAGWKTICMDYRANPASETNITLSSASTWKANLTLAEMQISELAEKAQHKQHASTATSSSSSSKPAAPLTVVIHCAGSWLGGGVASSEFVESVDPMLDINLKSAVSAAYLAGKFLTDSGAGMLMLTGAAAAASSSSGSALGLQPTSGMLAYGMSKAATHHLALSLAQSDSNLPRASTVVCVLPTMIDTPTNRKMTPNEAEYANWTPPRDFAQLALAFAQQLQAKVHGGKDAAATEHQTSVPLKHGGFYKFSTDKGQTRIEVL